jgi:hypothetical protein
MLVISICSNKNISIPAKLAIKFIKSGGRYSHYCLFLDFVKMYTSQNSGLTGNNVVNNLLCKTNLSSMI